MQRIMLVGAVLLTSFATSQAGEWVHFKNGHKILVESMRTDGDFVFLTIEQGKEVGFPKALIEFARPTQDLRPKGNDGPLAQGQLYGDGFDDMIGARAAMLDSGQIKELAGRVSGAGLQAGETYSLGFSFRGSNDITRQRGAIPTQSMKSAFSRLRSTNLAAAAPLASAGRLATATPADAVAGIRVSPNVTAKGRQID